MACPRRYGAVVRCELHENRQDGSQWGLVAFQKEEDAEYALGDLVRSLAQGFSGGLGYICIIFQA